MKNREERLAAHRKANKKRRAVMRKYLNDIKTESGCELCGYNEHPAALQFDHIDPSLKAFTIGNLDAGWDRLLLEIDKCRVLCANCHMIHTHG